MKGSNHERMVFLRQRVNQLATIIQSHGMGDEYVSYVKRIAKGEQDAEIVDEVEFDQLLVEEMAVKLFAHYTTMRTELLELTRRRDEAGTLERINEWLEAPVGKAFLTIGTLTHAAMLLAEILHHTGLFLEDPEFE